MEEIGAAAVLDTVAPTVGSSGKMRASALNIEELIDEPLLLRTERLLQEIPTIR